KCRPTKKAGRQPGLSKSFRKKQSLAGCSELLLFDLALQLDRLRRKLGGIRLDQEGIEATTVINALQRVGRHAKAHGAAQCVRDQRDVAQVRQKPALGLAVRVADFVANLSALGGQFAAPRHGENPLSSPEPARLKGARVGV